MSAHTVDRHMHTCPQAEVHQIGAYQQERTSADYVMCTEDKLLKVFLTVALFDYLTA